MIPASSETGEHRSQPGSTVTRTIFVVAILTAVLLLSLQSNRQLLELVNDWLSPMLALFAFGSALLTIATTGVRSGDRMSTAWGAYAMGVLMWFLAEVSWSVYPFLLGVLTPYPSLADFFGLAGYFPIIVGLLLQAWPFRDAFRSKKVFVGLMFVAFVAVFVVTSLLPLMLTQRESAGAIVVSLAYPLLDVTVLSIAVPSFLTWMEGTYWRPFLFLVLGIILGLLAHILFGWTNLIGVYYPGHPLELLYDWGYLSAALGFYLRRKQIIAKSL